MQGYPGKKQYKKPLTVLDATIVRCLLLLAVMHLLGEANWWMPEFLNFLPVITIESEPEEAFEVEEQLEAIAA